MIKLLKNLKNVWLKKNLQKKKEETALILKSIHTNFKLLNNQRFLNKLKQKKKILSHWQNCCFTLGLFKKTNSKTLMSRFVIKNKNKENKIIGWKIK